MVDANSVEVVAASVGDVVSDGSVVGVDVAEDEAVVRKNVARLLPLLVGNNGRKHRLLLRFLLWLSSRPPIQLKPPLSICSKLLREMRAWPQAVWAWPKRLQHPPEHVRLRTSRRYFTGRLRLQLLPRQ